MFPNGKEFGNRSEIVQHHVIGAGRWATLEVEVGLTDSVSLMEKLLTVVATA